MRIKYAISILALSVSVAAQTSPQPPWSCPDNLVKNGGLNLNSVVVGDGSMYAGSPSHTDDWDAASESPQLTKLPGCNNDPGYVSFWGNAAVGEAIHQKVTFKKGVTYAVSFCGRFHQGAIPYVNIALYAANGPLGTPACPAGTCANIFTTPNITAPATWTTFNTCWTAPQDATDLTIRPINAININDGAKVSWGEVDNICIRELKPIEIEGPKTTCTSPVTYCAKQPSTGPYSWNVTNGTFTTGNADNSCIVVNWNPPSGGLVTLTSVIGGCKVTSELKVDGCHKENCCKDFNINATNFTVTNASGGAYTFNANLSAPQAMTLKATIVSASHTVSPTSCGTAGPVNVYAAPAQPTTVPSGWSAPVVPIPNGNQVVWQTTAGPATLGSFPFNVILPPALGPTCLETITVCIEFQVTTQLVGQGCCRTCSIVRCFTFKRKGKEIVIFDLPPTDPLPIPNTTP